MQAADRLRQENYHMSDGEYTQLVKLSRAQKKQRVKEGSLETEVSAKAPRAR